MERLRGREEICALFLWVLKEYFIHNYVFSSEEHKRNTKIKQTVEDAYFYTMKETPVQYGTLNTGF